MPAIGDIPRHDWERFLESAQKIWTKLFFPLKAVFGQIQCHTLSYLQIIALERFVVIGGDPLWMRKPTALEMRSRRGCRIDPRMVICVHQGL
jgi:hypothetical protein